ncbi:FixH family protein [Umezawaea endophytica]|uniref:YtkA-like domain-containing protein n=1 Tax=Umezawaea endophytica TaxID=1654476 RepID=A0A9X2VIJ0_9PSEU|nr:hypothetical protein [Umezawaea endophytica]MCS7476722.1 hypothetical protein [Umezawaea endophytica]
MRSPFIAGAWYDRRLVLALVGVVCVAVAGALALVLIKPAVGTTGALRANGTHHAVSLTVATARVGTTAIDMTFTGTDGLPSTPDEVEVDVVMARMGHVLSTVDLVPTGPPGSYRAAAVELPMSGQYEITVRTSDPGGDDRIVFPLLVSG